MSQLMKSQATAPPKKHPPPKKIRINPTLPGPFRGDEQRVQHCPADPRALRPQGLNLRPHGGARRGGAGGRGRLGGGGKKRVCLPARFRISDPREGLVVLARRPHSSRGTPPSVSGNPRCKRLPSTNTPQHSSRHQTPHTPHNQHLLRQPNPPPPTHGPVPKPPPPPPPPDPRPNPRNPHPAPQARAGDPTVVLKDLDLGGVSYKLEAQWQQRLMEQVGRLGGLGLCRVELSSLQAGGTALMWSALLLDCHTDTLSRV